MIRLGWVWVALCVACGGGDEANLRVDVRTDYVPELEFASVRVELVEEATDVVRRQDLTASRAQMFVAGVPAGSFSDVPVGQHRLVVALMDSEGRDVATRVTTLELQEELSVLVVITRSCRDVMCPLSPGDPATECVAGTCVPPECSDQNPAACGGATCTLDTNCPPASVACAASVCQGGTCLVEANDALCEAGQWCNPDVGCMEIPMSLMDSGMMMPPTDGGPSPDALVPCGGEVCDDSNACTADGCLDDECTHVPVEDGTECGPDATCMAGECIGCVGAGLPDGCDGVDTDCDGSLDEDCGCSEPGDRANMVATLQGVGRDPSLVVDSTGAVHVAFRNASDNDLIYSYHPPFGFWELSEAETSSQTVGVDADIAVGPDGSVHMVHRDSSNNDLRYAFRGPLDSDWQLAVIDTTGDVGRYPAIFVDGSGGVHVSYWDNSNNDLKYALRPAGGLWESVPAATEGSVGEYSGVAVDAQGGVHISYYDSSNGALGYAYRPSGGTFTTELADDPESGSRGQFTSIAVDDAGGVHIGYHDVSNRDALYAYKASGATMWQLAPMEETGDVGRELDLALVGNVPHAVYRDASNNDLRHAELAGAMWVSEAIETTGSMGDPPSIAAGPNGSLHITHRDTSNNDLRYGYRAAGETSWQVEPIDAFGTQGRYNAVAVGADGRVHVAYHKSDRDLAYATRVSGGLWSQARVATTGDVGRRPSIDVDENDRPVIAHYDNTNSALSFAYLEGGAWMVREVDNTASVGDYPSVVAHSSGEILIAYYDASASDLKVAIAPSADGTFEPQVLEATGSVGQYTAMREDPEGGVHLAYHDISNRDVRYAYRPSGGAFSSPSAVATAGTVGRPTAMAIGADSAVHLSFYDESNLALGYAVRPPGSLWSLDTALGEGVMQRMGRYNGIAVDSNGIVHVAAFDESLVVTGMTAQSRRDVIRATHSPGGDWSGRIVLDDEVGINEGITVGAGPGGYVYIAFSSNSEDNLHITRICP